jgi:hypothetical protein
MSCRLAYIGEVVKDLQKLEPEVKTRIKALLGFEAIRWVPEKVAAA